MQTQAVESAPATEAKQPTAAENREASLALARGIYSGVMQDEAFRKATDEQRYNFLTERFKNFQQAYPMVIKYMALYLQYNEKAFTRFMDKLQREPGKGMEGYIERQADYAKFLYEETCRARKKHINSKKAGEIWGDEYNIMIKQYRDMQEQEKKARSEFELENRKHMDERRRELLDFIDSNAEEMPLPPPPAEFVEQFIGKDEKPETPAEKPAVKITEVDITGMTVDELRGLYKITAEYEMELISEFYRKEHMLEHLQEEYTKTWLAGTSADPTRKH
jgi:hypothetical protein